MRKRRNIAFAVLIFAVLACFAAVLLFFVAFSRFAKSRKGKTQDRPSPSAKGAVPGFSTFYSFRHRNFSVSQAVEKPQIDRHRLRTALCGPLPYGARASDCGSPFRAVLVLGAAHP